MFYLFVFQDESIYEMTNAVTFKDAIWEMQKYEGESSEMMHKCFKGYESDDVDGLIELFNHFQYKTISKVFLVSDTIYDAYSEHNKTSWCK